MPGRVVLSNPQFDEPKSSLQKMEYGQMDLNKVTSSCINSIPSPINGSENINFGS